MLVCNMLALSSCLWSTWWCW